MSLPLPTLYNSEILSDVLLHLEDENEIMTLNLHKNILYLGCPYFRPMFSNFSEKKSKEITIIVPNVVVANDIIQSFYGINKSKNNNWKYVLSMYQCKNFFGIDVKFPKNINVPKEDFEDFINYIEIFGFDKNTNRLIVQNIPKKYNTNELFTLLKKMDYSDNDCKNFIINYIRNSSKKYNPDKLLSLLKKIDYNDNDILWLVADHITKESDCNALSEQIIKDLWKLADTYYILQVFNNNIKIIDNEGKCYRTIDCGVKIKKFCYLRDHHKIAYSGKNTLFIFDIKLNKHIGNPINIGSISQMFYYNNNIIIHDNYKLKIINTRDYEVDTHDFGFDKIIHKIDVCKENELVILCKNRYSPSTFCIFVYDLLKGSMNEEKIFRNIVDNVIFINKTKIMHYKNTESSSKLFIENMDFGKKK
uniref:Putative BTB_POZ domain-containing protein n=1 Tax=Moumouvirus sp. 'Monve' TaxID=1128131 RepID=H2EFQ3_9VIRU|nr:putative BTB_POZ domain-containing protein [Moumouvirus Monve]